jgi:hypothetical protein
MTADMNTVRESDVATAITMGDLDDALVYLAAIAGITRGGVADWCFSDFDWSNADRDQREHKVRTWLREAAHANDN